MLCLYCGSSFLGIVVLCYCSCSCIIKFQLGAKLSYLYHGKTFAKSPPTTSKNCKIYHASHITNHICTTIGKIFGVKYQWVGHRWIKRGEIDIIWSDVLEFLYFQMVNLYSFLFLFPEFCIFRWFICTILVCWVSVSIHQMSKPAFLRGSQTRLSRNKREVFV